MNSVPSTPSVLALLNIFGSYLEPAALSCFAERPVFSSSVLDKSLKCHLQPGKNQPHQVWCTNSAAEDVGAGRDG